MTDLRRYSLAAVVLLVVLRVALGWQLLYEGLWKIDTLRTPKPWTSEGYLKNSVGPMRDTFREMTGDPNELAWLDYDKVSAKWKSWAERFQKHYSLDSKQSEALIKLLNGSTSRVGDKNVYAQPLAALPPGMDDLNAATRVSKRVIWYDVKRKQLLIDSAQIMTPTDKARLEAFVKRPSDLDEDADWEPSKEQQDYLKAVNTAFERQKKSLGYLKKLSGALVGDPELTGNEDWQRIGKLDQYKKQLAEYEADYAKASTSFEWDHLAYTWKKIQSLRAELTGPIKAMEADLKDDADKILNLEQRLRGPLRDPMSTVKFADMMTIAGLTILGFMLITGLFSRFAAVAAAFMLFNFYLAMPPLPGVPALPGPEHSFIVNKNLIEVFALLALAALPTGMWFGLDGLLSIFFKNWKADKKAGTALKSTVATGDEPTEAPAAAPAT